MLSETILNTVLQDDETDYGGVSRRGETALDFLQSIGEDVHKVTLPELNQMLKECGIREIE